MPGIAILAVIRFRSGPHMPGRFRFHTCIDTTISIERIITLTPDYDSPDFNLAALMDRVRQLMQSRINRASEIN